MLFFDKVKLRYTDLGIFESSLNILVAYEKEQRPIMDVYTQITPLFKSFRLP